MDDFPIFLKWQENINWLFLTVEKFPKKVRVTISDRLLNLGLDIMEDFTEARYSKSKLSILRRANLKLEKMRLLLRLCHQQKILSHQAYKHGSYVLNEVGQMLGGWIKQQEHTT
jgi:hypothetical protein